MIEQLEVNPFSAPFSTVHRWRRLHPTIMKGKTSQGGEERVHQTPSSAICPISKIDRTCVLPRIRFLIAALFFEFNPDTGTSASRHSAPLAPSTLFPENLILYDDRRKKSGVNKNTFSARMWGEGRSIVDRENKLAGQMGRRE